MKYFFAFILMITSCLAKANEIEMIYYHPPGGSADLHSRALITLLEDQNIKVKRTWLKSCGDAIQYTMERRNTYMVTLTSDLRYRDSARCPSVTKTPNLRLITTLAETPFLFCTSPHRRGLTIKNMASAKNILIGVPTVDVNWIPFNIFVKNFKSPLDVKLIPYKGAGDLKAAVLGQNVDMFYVSSTVIDDLLSKGAVCHAASTRSNALDLPYMGTFLNNNHGLAETSLTTVLWSTDVNPVVLDKIKTALSSEQFRKSLVPMNSVHKGIGSGLSQTQMLDMIRAMDSILTQ